MNKLSLRFGGIILSYMLKIVMIIFLIISIWKLHWVWIFGCIITLIISLIPALLKRNYQITLPLLLEILVTIALILHVGGGLLGAYKIPHYDTFTHFISSFLVAFLTFVIIYILDEYWEGLKMDKYAMAFVTVIFTMAVGVFLEFIKWLNVTGTYYVRTNHVLMLNLSADTIAGIIIAIIGVNLIKSGKFDEMTDDFGKQIDSILIDRIESKVKTK